VKELIKRILIEERGEDLSKTIENLIRISIDEYEGYVCDVEAHQNVLNPKKYSVKIIFVKSRLWPTNYALEAKVMNQIYDKIYDYMNLSVDLVSVAVKNCGTRKEVQNESELTERCWKGYTQKGMKTMFGKRYPNCVKKTK
jgi:hypothetical protein